MKLSNLKKVLLGLAILSFSTSVFASPKIKDIEKLSESERNELVKTLEKKAEVLDKKDGKIAMDLYFEYIGHKDTDCKNVFNPNKCYLVKSDYFQNLTVDGLFDFLQEKDKFYESLKFKPKAVSEDVRNAKFKEAKELSESYKELLSLYFKRDNILKKVLEEKFLMQEFNDSLIDQFSIQGEYVPEEDGIKLSFTNKLPANYMVDGVVFFANVNVPGKPLPIFNKEIDYAFSYTWVKNGQTLEEIIDCSKELKAALSKEGAVLSFEVKFLFITLGGPRYKIAKDKYQVWGTRAEKYEENKKLISELEETNAQIKIKQAAFNEKLGLKDVPVAPPIEEKKKRF